MSSPSPKGVALVTGAARGIGRSVALRLASDGFDVVINDIPANLDSLKVVASLIESTGRRAGYIVADVSQETEVKRMVSEAVQKLGGLDVVRTILCLDRVSSNRAADETLDGSECRDCSDEKFHRKSVKRRTVAFGPANGPIPATADELDRVLAVNIRGTFLCYKYAAKQMIAQGRGGRIIGAHMFLAQLCIAPSYYLIGACSGAGKKGMFKPSRR